MITTLWEESVAFHGHACPGLAIGVRAAHAVLEDTAFGYPGYGKLFCVTENDSCGVDAVQCLLGCSIGKGNLVYRGTGKHAFSFFNRENGKSIRFYLIAGKADGIDRAAWQNILLTAPFEQVFTRSTPHYAAPEEAHLFVTVQCEICGEGAPEHKMRLQEGKKVCLDCYKGYDRGW